MYFDGETDLKTGLLENSFLNKCQRNRMREKVKKNKKQNKTEKKRAQLRNSKAMCHLKESQKAHATVAFLSKLFCLGPLCTKLIYTKSIRQESTKLPLMRCHPAQSTVLVRRPKRPILTRNVFCTGHQLKSREMARMRKEATRAFRSL